MPAPLLGPLIVAGGQVAGAGLNAAATGAQNRKSRQWSEQMYNRQYQDNINFWRMQNEYNSPEQQMSRLKNAGLNPNLVYGGSSAGAAGQAGNISTPDVQAPQFRVPEFGNSLNQLASYFDTEIKQAQVDNLKTQNTVLLGEAALKAAQTENTIAQTDTSRFNLGLESELREVSADYRRAVLHQTKANTEFTISQNERAAVMQDSNLREAAERILKMRAETATNSAQRAQIYQSIRNMRADEQLRKLEIELREMGINPNAPMFWQILGRILNDTIGNPLESAGAWFKNLWK